MMCGRYRVEPAHRPGMATSDSANRQPEAAQRAVSFYRLDGVCRTGRCKPALPAQPGTQEKSVEPDRRNQQGFDHDLGPRGLARANSASASARAARFNAVSDAGATLLCRRTT